MVSADYGSQKTVSRWLSEVFTSEFAFPDRNAGLPSALDFGSPIKISLEFGRIEIELSLFTTLWVSFVGYFLHAGGINSIF